VPVDWLIFCLGLLIVTPDKVKAIEISYWDAHLLVTFSGVSYYNNREFVFMFSMIQKRKNKHQNTQQSDLTQGLCPLVQIRLKLRRYAPLLKSVSLMFCCSLYYLCHYLQCSCLGGVCGQVVKIIDFKPLDSHLCGFESWQELLIIFLWAFRMTVVLLRCLFMPEIMYRRSTFISKALKSAIIMRAGDLPYEGWWPYNTKEAT
jgi:hypothetical protein